MEIESMVQNLVGNLSKSQQQEVATDIGKGKFNDAISLVLNMGGNIFPSIATIPIIVIVGIILAIVIAVTLKRSYDEMKDVDPTLVDIPTTGRAILYGLLWGIGFIAVFLVMNFFTGGIAGFVSILFLILLVIFYFSVKSLGWGVKDLKDASGQKVKASKWSFMLGSLIAALVVSITVCIVYGIVSYKIKKNVGDKLAPYVGSALGAAVGIPL